MNKGRIVVMLPRFSRYGGVEGIAYRLTQGLAAKGHTVHVICARQEAEAPDGVSVISVGRVGGLRALKMLWFLVFAERARRKGRYDVSISLGKTWKQDIARTGGGPLQVFWRLSIQAWPGGWRRILKKTGRLLSAANWLTFLVERRMFTQTPHIVAISDTVRRWLEETYPHLEQSPDITGQHLYIIYNNPDISSFSPPSEAARMAARQEFTMPAEVFALGAATTNFLLKGVGPLIHTLRYLAPEIHLYIAGGRGASAYMRLAERFGVAHRVHFLGKVTDMPRFYHSLDMFILPTFFDTLGNVVLEAMACGVKTLCSDRAGAQDFLPPDQIIKDPGDPRKIAEKVLMLRAKKALVPLELKGTGVDDLVDLTERVLEDKRRQADTTG